MAHFFLFWIDGPKSSRKSRNDMESEPPPIVNAYINENSNKVYNNDQTSHENTQQQQYMGEIRSTNNNNNNKNAMQRKKSLLTNASPLPSLKSFNNYDETESFTKKMASMQQNAQTLNQRPNTVTITHPGMQATTDILQSINNLTPPILRDNDATQFTINVPKELMETPVVSRHPSQGGRFNNNNNNNNNYGNFEFCFIFIVCLVSFVFFGKENTNTN